MNNDFVILPYNVINRIYTYYLIIFNFARENLVVSDSVILPYMVVNRPFITLYGIIAYYLCARSILLYYRKVEGTVQGPPNFR